MEISVKITIHEWNVTFSVQLDERILYFTSAIFGFSLWLCICYVFNASTSFCSVDSDRTKFHIIKLVFEIYLCRFIFFILLPFHFHP